ncbi:GAF domain-containing protein [Bradyrhizobium sp. BR13661]|jgi:GAF domain-containing protein|uniref:GAF domain-containing protein n=1 Tax=Bradyrhizobium sp. BR13661 TaxID=2940622 RepID=UPI002476921B|nr:GAF domain-containing protein [Bradyrhizobium sp. BR13661]MDH6259571.1 GAF domain-containing protein [Bradyrhizobium sp. BR13661]
MARRSAAVSGARKQRGRKVAKTAAMKPVRKPASVAELRAQMTAASRVLELIAKSPTDVQPVFDAIVQTVVRLVGCETAFIQRCDGKHFWSVARCRRDDGLVTVVNPRHAPIDPNANFPSRAIVSRATLHLPDWSQIELPEFERRIQEQLGYHSAVYLPLLREDECIGVLGLAGSRPGMFGETEIALAESFRDQAFIAIENTRLFNETQNALAQQKALSNILSVISNSVADVEPVFDEILRSVQHLFDVEDRVIFRIHGDLLHIAAVDGPNADAVRRLFPVPLRGTTTDEAIRERRLVSYDDVLNGEGVPDGLRAVAARFGYSYSIATAPLLAGDRAIGSLVVARVNMKPFAEDERLLLQTLADQAVIAIENARLFNETQESLQQQTATAEVLQIISDSPGELQPVFEAVLQKATRICDARFGSLLRFDGNAFHFAADVGTPEALREYMRRPGPFQGLAGGMIDRIHRTRQVQHTADYAAEAAPGLAAKLGGARSTLGVPILRDDELVGAIVIYRQEVRPFSEREIELVRSFAAQAAIAIENARLFNETREALERQTATSDILKVIASSPSDTQPVFEAIVGSAARLFAPCAATITTLRDGKLHWNAVAELVRSFDHEAAQATYPIAFDPERSPSAQAMLERRIIQIPDVSAPDTPEFTRRIALAGGFRSITFVPLVHNDKGIGTIILTHPILGFRHTDKQLALIQTFADQAVIAIENARLFDEVQAKTRDLTEALAYQTGSGNVLRVIASSPTDINPVLEAIVESARELCESDDAVALLKDGENLRFSAHSGPIALRIGKWPISRTWTAGRAFVDRKPVHVHDMLSQEGAEYPDARAMGQATGAAIRTVLSVPLLRGDESIGAILLRRTEVRPFKDKQIDLLSTFADQAVIAIQNARLFTETREALERQTATSDILNVIASSPTDTRPVFEAIASRAKSLVGGFSSTVFRFIDGQAYLEAFTPTTPEADEVLTSTFPMPVADFAPFLMAQSGEVTQIPDIEAITDQIRDIGRARGFRSMLFAPLMNKGVSIGLIATTRIEPGRFAEDHVQLLKTFADQAVIAIENVRLFDEVQAKTRDLEVALQQQTATADVLRIISRSVAHAAPVFDTILEACGRLFHPFDAAIYLVEGDRLRGVAHRGPGAGDWGTDTMPLEGSQTGLAIAMRQPIHLHDLTDKPEVPEDKRAALREAGGMTVLYAPMMSQDSGVGSLVLTRRPKRPFTESEVGLIQTFADQAVIAIENARLFDEVQARTQELSKSLEDLRTAQDRLVQTEKLASLGQLTAGIAHEIKNPLNFVNNFSALSTELTDELRDVLAGENLTAPGREQVDELTGLLKDNLGKVVQHGKRADSIVKNMLQHSREGSGERRSQDLNALVSESLNLAYHGARAERSDFNITLEQDLDPDAGAVEVYPQDITRALLNLFSNGFYAAISRKKDADGTAFEPVLSTTTRRAGNTVEIRIRDNGTGIPAEIREKIFNPFFTTKPTGEGTGLGLSMTHDIIVKQHGGRIDLATEAGAFTEFTITLPRANGGTKPT